MQTFVRMSKLSNIVGRADYISNPARQEHIVLARSYADWKPYQEFERTHQRSSKANNEGRELIIALPNEWAELSEVELASRMNELAQQILIGKWEYQWAVHWNKSHTNLHAHLIFSERDRLYARSSEVWDRDIYLTQDGKIARRKADRAVDRNGKVKPPIHRKGEPKDNGKPAFTPKDTKFKSKAWLNQTKALVADFYSRYGITITEQGLLHQYHEGKGREASAIRDKNKRVQRWNAFFKPYQEFGFVFPEGGRLLQTLQNIPKSTNLFDLVRSIALKCPQTTRLRFPPEIEKPLRDRIHAAGLKVIRHQDPKTQQLFAIVPFQHANALQQMIDELTQDAPAAVKQDAAASPADAAQIIALRDDYFRKACVLGYLETVRTSTDAQQSYEAAQQIVRDFDAAAKECGDLNDQIKATFNPIKKIKLRSQLGDATYQLQQAAARLRDRLGINMICNGQEFDSSTATRDETSMISRRTSFPLEQQRKAAASESKRNAMIRRLSAENVTPESIRDALRAFERACRGIPAEQRQAVYAVLRASPAPSRYEFEQSEYISASRRSAQETVARVISALKPVAPQPQHDHKQEQTQDVVSRPPQNFGFHR